MPFNAFRRSLILFQFFQTFDFLRQSSNSVDFSGLPELLSKYDLNLLISLTTHFPVPFNVFKSFFNLLQYIFLDLSRFSSTSSIIFWPSFGLLSCSSCLSNLPRISPIFLSVFRSFLLSATFQAFSQFPFLTHQAGLIFITRPLSIFILSIFFNFSSFRVRVFFQSFVFLIPNKFP